MALQVEIVSAEQQVWSGEARSLLVRTLEGEMGILGGHEPVLAVLAEGEVRVRAQDGKDVVASIGGGFLSVDHDRAVVVAEDVDVRGATGSATRR